MTNVYLQFSPSEFRCFLLVDSVRIDTTSADAHVLGPFGEGAGFCANRMLRLLNEPLRSP